MSKQSITNQLGIGQIFDKFEAGTELFDRFKLKELLGKSDISAIWSVEDTKTKRDIALKIVPKIVLCDESGLRQLKRAVEGVRRLNHPNIVPVYELVEDDNWVAMVTEPVKGKALSELQAEQSDKVFDLPTTKKLLDQIVAAVQYAHGQHGILHCKLTPESVLVDEHYRVVVTDFLISRVITDNLQRATRNSGADDELPYLSPQQLDGENAMVADDVYSLGAVVYQMLTGKPPFEGENIIRQIRNDQPKSIAARREELGIAGDGIPAEWEKLVAGCLAKRVNQRPASISELATGSNATSAPAPTSKKEKKQAKASADKKSSDKKKNSGKSSTVVAAGSKEADESKEKTDEPQEATKSEATPAAGKSERAQLISPRKRCLKEEPSTGVTPVSKNKDDQKDAAAAAALASAKSDSGDKVGKIETSSEMPKGGSPFAVGSEAAAKSRTKTKSKSRPSRESKQSKKKSDSSTPWLIGAAAVLAIGAVVWMLNSVDVEDYQPQAGNVANIEIPETDLKFGSEPKKDYEFQLNDQSSETAGSIPEDIITDRSEVAMLTATPSPVETIAKIDEQSDVDSNNNAPLPVADINDVAIREVVEEGTEEPEDTLAEAAAPAIAEVDTALDESGSDLTPVANEPVEARAVPADEIDAVAPTEAPVSSVSDIAATLGLDPENLTEDERAAIDMLIKAEEAKNAAQRKLQDAKNRKVAEEKLAEINKAIEEAQKLAEDKNLKVEEAKASLIEVQGSRKEKVDAARTVLLEAQQSQKEANEKKQAAETAKSSLEELSSQVAELTAKIEEQKAAYESSLAEAEEAAKQAAAKTDQASEIRTSALETDSVIQEAQETTAAAEKEAAAAREEAEALREQAEKIKEQISAGNYNIKIDTSVADPSDKKLKSAQSEDQAEAEMPGKSQAAAQVAADPEIASPKTAEEVPLAEAETERPDETGSAAPPPVEPGIAIENSLGMKFIPVGDVFFSVWETRVSDFKAFVETTGYQPQGREWNEPGFNQQADHPVINITWEDAMAFCQWLTEQDRKAGIIQDDQFYRLPTDMEWSRAVGLTAESGPTPESRDMDVTGVYPWGNEWPPPAKAGNYTGEESKSDIAIPGHNDGFVWTAPVGSFKPTPTGLYDMGGNAWEWVMDWWNADQRARVLRGGSWYNGSLKLSLLSSTRICSAPTGTTDNYGFRTVIADVPLG